MLRNILQPRVIDSVYNLFLYIYKLTLEMSMLLNKYDVAFYTPDMLIHIYLYIIGN